jgi:hypothetical protein
MPDFKQELSLTSPYMRGPDVLHAQRALRSFGFAEIEADGLFGRVTANAVRAFQSGRSLNPSGSIDRQTWNALFSDTPSAAPVARTDFAGITRKLLEPRQFRDSVPWALTDSGIAINGQPAVGTPGLPITIDRILTTFGNDIADVCIQRSVFIELVVATIATESHGNPGARYEEPGFQNETATPDRISIGLMQTLISTARSATGDPTLTAEALMKPRISINAGTAYIESQFNITGFDPPKVACAYNAGGVYYNPSPNNRWKMRQYPIGTARHADRFVGFFNDCFCVIRTQGPAGALNAPSLAVEFDNAQS